MRRSVGSIVLVVAVAGLAFAVPARAAVATNSTTSYCPFTFMNDPAGPDADYVTFLGPASISSGDSVMVGASEQESAANPVTITVVATPSNGSSPVVSQMSGTHDATTSLALTGASGTIWTLNWAATFDFGAHPCASALPGYHAFTVTIT
jgi:hypothetical protein